MFKRSVQNGLLWLHQSVNQRAGARNLFGRAGAADKGERYPTAIIVKEAASGAHERQVFDNLCKSLQAGDTLVVCKMDRFCRSAKEGLKYVDLLRDKGVAVHILNMGLLDNSPMGRLVATMLLAFAEFERAQIIERTQSGRQAAMAKPGFGMAAH